MIEEFGGRPIKAGESFSAAFVVGYFDSIDEMHQVYDQHKGHTRLEVSPDGWKLMKTKGTAPQAGIDLEPNHPSERPVDCLVEDRQDRPFLATGVKSKDVGLSHVRGTIKVNNPHGARVELPPRQQNVTIKAQ
jgi:hypothetical protein